MNRLQYKKGLLYTSIEPKFEEKSIIIEDVIIDLVDLNIYRKET